LIYAVRHDPPRGISSADLVVRKNQKLHRGRLEMRGGQCVFLRRNTMKATFAKTGVRAAKRIAARAVVTVMAITALTMLPKPTEAQASQAAAVGTFTLPGPARLGDVPLPAGAYKYTLRWTSAVPLLEVSAVRGDLSAFIFPSAVHEDNGTVADALTLAPAMTGGMYVHSISIAGLKRTLIYDEPRVMIAKRYVMPGTATAQNVQPAK
jgi:hypothetical protein